LGKAYTYLRMSVDPGTEESVPANGPPQPPSTGIVRQDGVQLEADVQWFHGQKGFGFLNNVNDGGDPVFVHFKDIAGFPYLVPNTRVQFVFHNTSDEKRGKAGDVRTVGGGEIKSHGSMRSEKFRKRLAANPEIKLGHCKWFDPSKGYGFIMPVEGGEDVFAHYRVCSVLHLPGIEKINIPKGMDVEFQVMKDEQGKPKCTTVTGPGGEALNPVGPATNPMPYMERTPLVPGPGFLPLPNGPRTNKRQAAAITRPALLHTQAGPVLSPPLASPLAKRGKPGR